MVKFKWKHQQKLLKAKGNCIVPEKLGKERGNECRSGGEKQEIKEEEDNVDQREVF